MRKFEEKAKRSLDESAKRVRAKKKIDTGGSLGPKGKCRGSQRQKKVSYTTLSQERRGHEKKRELAREALLEEKRRSVLIDEGRCAAQKKGVYEGQGQRRRGRRARGSSYSRGWPKG